MMLEINKIYCEDCLEGMRKIDDKSIDMILADLPYGIGKNRYDWNEIIPFDSLWKQYERIIKINGIIVLTANQPFTSKLILSNLKLFKYELIWQKTRNTYPFLANKRPLPQHENILIFGIKNNIYNPQKIKSKKPYKVNSNTVGKINGNEIGTKWDGTFKYSQERFPSSVIKISNPSRKSGLHPTQKPVELFEYLIKTSTKENDLILDNVIGSGTTAIAAINTNRNYIGFENDPKYYQIAIDRVEKHLKENYALQN